MERKLRYIKALRGTPQEMRALVHQQAKYSVYWEDVNLQNKTITITGIKGHRTRQYPISDELCTLLLQIPIREGRIFSIKHAEHINGSIRDYRRKLTKETGNPDFDKIHFHTFRHFAIS